MNVWDLLTLYFHGLCALIQSLDGFNRPNIQFVLVFQCSSAICCTLPHQSPQEPKYHHSPCSCLCSAATWRLSKYSIMKCLSDTYPYPCATVLFARPPIFFFSHRAPPVPWFWRNKDPNSEMSKTLCLDFCFLFLLSEKSTGSTPRQKIVIT